MPTRIRLLDHVVEIAPDLARGDLLPLLYRHLLTEAAPDLHLAIERSSASLLAARLYGEGGLDLRRPVPPGGDPLAEAHRLLLESTLARTREYLVLHAGAVGRGGRALLVLGESWAGKTTLVEALAGLGFALLSDDYAPLRVSDLRVAPFPRALGRRAGTRSPAAPPLRAREWVDPLELAELVTEPLPVGAIAVLAQSPPAAPPAAFFPLTASEALAHLRAALRNPHPTQGIQISGAAPPAPDELTARLAALAGSVPCALLARGGAAAMARSAAALLP